MSTKSIPKSNPDKSYSFAMMPVEIRALIASFFTVYFMFLTGLVAYTWGYLHGQIDNVRGAYSSNTQTQIVNRPEDSASVMRAGTITQISESTFEIRLSGSAETIKVLTNAETQYLLWPSVQATIDEASGRPVTRTTLSRNDFVIGNTVQIAADEEPKAEGTLVKIMYKIP